ncbi:MAG: WGR domain-containing protein [Deltaproteobacteria bacterium]|nr:WGR domain-containing protein [Deltaproteobacteria bacterium]
MKKLGSDADAKKLHDKLVGEKTGKGYVEGGGKVAKPAKGAPAKGAAKTGKAAKGAPVERVGKPEVIVIPAGAYRLEVVEGKSSKFWQIHRNDKTVTVTFGKIGTPGTVQKKKHKDEWKARGDFNKQLEDKKKKGYQFVMAGPRVTPPPAALNPQLEAAVVKDPSDDAFLVYGDWLMEQGDPRGDMAALRGDDNKKQAAAAKLAWKNRAFFYGPLAVFVTEKAEYPAVEATWRHGWMDTLRLSAINMWQDGVIPVGDAAELVRLLPKVSSARMLRELVIGSPVSDSEFNFRETIKELVKAMPQLPNLRRVFFGDFTYEDSELSWSNLGPLKDFWPVAGKLEYLKIHAGSMELGKIDAPELRELWIETGGFDKKNVESIQNANMPKLETLNLWFGQDNYGCDVQVKHLAALIEALPKKFPKLRHLGIANSTWGNELAPILVKAKIVKQLETLDLSRSHLTDQGIKVYADANPFKHLASLDVSECLLGKEGKKLAKALAKSVNVDDQDDPSDHQPDPDDPGEKDSWWRYSRVGE